MSWLNVSLSSIISCDVLSAALALSCKYIAASKSESLKSTLLVTLFVWSVKNILAMYSYVVAPGWLPIILKSFILYPVSPLLVLKCIFSCSPTGNCPLYVIVGIIFYSIVLLFYVLFCVLAF